MFTTGAGKPININTQPSLSPEEDKLLKILNIPNSLYFTFLENCKAARFFHSLSNRAVSVSLEERMQIRFTKMTYKNSVIGKIKSRDIPSGVHLVLAVAEVHPDYSLLTDFFQFIRLRTGEAPTAWKVGEFLRLQGAQLEVGQLVPSPNGVRKVALEIPFRVNHFGLQNYVPPVPRLGGLVSGDVPYMRLVVWRPLQGVWVVFTDSGRFLVTDADREEFLELHGAAITGMQWNFRAVFTDPWCTRFTTAAISAVMEGDEGEITVKSGEAFDVMNATASIKDGALTVATTRQSRTGKTAIKYFLTSGPGDRVCCDLLVAEVEEKSEGVFVLDGVSELRVVFKSGLFNPQKKLARLRKRLFRAGGQLTLRNLQKIQPRLYVADLLDIEAN